MSDGY